MSLENVNRPNETRQAFHWHIVGRVQGVAFRYFTQQAARRLGLSGWVRNRADGTVELEASGPAESLVQLEEMLWQGPRMARVDGVEKRPLDPATGPPKGFEIRY